MSRLARDPEVEALVGAYRADLEAAGKFAGNPMISPARSFLLRVGVEVALLSDALWHHRARLGRDDHRILEDVFDRRARVVHEHLQPAQATLCSSPSAWR